MAGDGAALFVAVFLACTVEAVEALTIVLAAGTVRDWRSALTGVGAGLVVLAVIVAALGPALTAVPMSALRLIVGGLLLIFGLQWLRKAILRATGFKALHDEDAIFAREAAAARTAGCGALRGHGLVRVHPVVQGRRPGGPGSGLHRGDFRCEPGPDRSRPYRRAAAIARGRRAVSPCAARWPGSRRTP